MTFSNQPILVNGDALPYVKTLSDDSIARRLNFDYKVCYELYN
ncbi:hypothetical protein [Candidatus Arsenophonus triatominarum]|nr:hypothetical protein [Candidatus Arsenophonus triatominarum]